MTAQTIVRALEKRDTGLDKLMWSKAKHLESILPEHVDVKAFLGTAWAALLASDRLMQNAVNKPDTLLIALFRCAAKGHQPGTEEYYLTPRDGGVLGIEGYRGIIERMYRSGAVSKVVVREVCVKDYFRFVEGEDDKPVHDFAARRGGTTGADFFGQDGNPNRGDMVGVYAVARFMTGDWSRPVLLGRNDVYAARASGGWKPDDKYSPWNRADAGPDHPEFTGRSMWLKTAARRLEPWVPTSAEYRREQLRASANAAAASGQGMPVLAAEASDIREAEIVEPPAITVTPENGNGILPHAAARDADDGTLPVEDPPEWPEAAKPGTGTLKGKLGDRAVSLRRTPITRDPQRVYEWQHASRTPLKSRAWMPSARITASRAGNSPAAESGKSAARKKTATPGRAESFPPAVAALIDARDPWCVHCGSVDGLQRHHRRIKGIGGDPRPHTDCACNGVRLCWLCHSWAHSGKGRREAVAEGLIILRATVKPFALSALVHLQGDVGGQRMWPSCDGRWLDYVPERGAA